MAIRRSILATAWMAAAASVVAACGGGSQGSPDAAPYHPCSDPPPAGLCTDTCGNDHVDFCETPTMPGHCTYMQVEEICDGTDVQSCADLGYYGGASVCTGCQLDDGACEACNPGDLACATLPPFEVFDLAVSGSNVALASPSAIAIVQDLSVVAQATVEDSRLVGIPGGWLVATAESPATLVTLDPAGVLGTPHALPGAYFPAMAYGPGDRVLVAWQDNVPEWHVSTAIADASGNVIVPPASLFSIPSGGFVVDVTTDGTSFFVGSNSKLARIAPDGTRTIVSGFPIQDSFEDRVEVTWSGTSGWYVSSPRDAPSATPGSIAQRFDANGVKVGAPVSIPLVAIDYVADGLDLLALVATDDKRLAVVRIDPTGTIGAPEEVGGGQYVAYATHFAHLGSDLFVTWSRRGHLQLARVAP